MYSLVLMTALTASPDTAEFNGYFRNLFGGGNCSGSSSAGGCTGAYAPRYSCYGGGCSGAAAYPAGCTGTSASPGNCCGGGGSIFGLGTRVRRLFDRNGCCGGSGSGYGCTGSGYGCSGASAYSCFGGPAVSYTPMVNGGLSCYGGLPLSAPPPVFDTFPAQPYPAPGGSFAPTEPAPGVGGLNTGLRPAGGVSPSLVSGGEGNRATVLIRLPADARLFADTRPLELTGSERKFVSPELPAGQDFLYRFRAEYERDGETVSVTKKIAVRAGAVVAVEFADLTAKAAPEKTTGATGSGNSVTGTPTSNPVPPVAPVVPAVMPAAPPVPPVAAPAATSETARATLTVKLPPGAVLFVDDRKSPSIELIRTFSTPPLPTGREFAYLMRAEIVRNGQTETFTQKVPFRAGEKVEVDFTSVGR